MGQFRTVDPEDSDFIAKEVFANSIPFNIRKPHSTGLDAIITIAVSLGELIADV